MRTLKLTIEYDRSNYLGRRGFRDPELWNICCDLVVNGILVFEENMAHPNWIVLEKKYWKKSDGSTWTVEEIYDELYKKIEEAKKQYKLQCACVQKDPTAQKGDGKEDKDSEGSGHADGCGHSDPRGWTDVNWDKGLEEDWKQAVIASDQMTRMRGTSPAWLKTLVDDLVEPPVPIEKILQHIIGNIVSDETTWKCPNRRFVSRGLHLPSAIHDRKDGIIAIDTSGSIGDDEAKDFLGIAVRAMRTKGINELRVIQCDAEIKDDTRTKDVSAVKLHIKRTGSQHGDYVYTQLNAFRVGERANDAAKMMRSIAAKMTDADMKAVSSYIQGLQ